MVGSTIAAQLREPGRSTWLLSFPPAAFALLALMPTLVLLWPEFLPARYQSYIHKAFPSIPLPLVGGWVLALILVLAGAHKRHWQRPSWLYGATALSFALLILVADPIKTTISFQRSSKDLAKKAASLIGSEDGLVLLSGYPSSLPFYLRIRRPIAVVWSKQQSTVLGSDYVAMIHPEPASGYGKVLYTQEEFANLWSASEHRLFALVSRGELERFESLQKIPFKRIANLDGNFLLENRRAE
jgi:hypothetical protein